LNRDAISFEPDDIHVVIEGEEPTPRRRGQAHDTAASDRLRAQAELVDIHNRRLAQERTIADANWRELNARQETARYRLQAANETGDEQAASAQQAEIARLEGLREGVRQRLNHWNSQSERQAPRYTHQTEEFLNRHPDLLTASGEPSDAARGAHHLAVSAGLKPDSPGYFEHVEKTLGLRGGGNGNGRSSGRSVGAESNSVHLNAHQRQLATDGTMTWGRHDLAAGRIKDASKIGSPIGVHEYARRLLAMERDGYGNKDKLWSK
jgi:hypothetical protein